MKNRLTLQLSKVILFLVIVSLSLSYGCKRDLLQPNYNTLKNKLSFNEARQYFEANLKQLGMPNKLMAIEGKGSVLPKATIEAILYNKEPIWDKAYQKVISSGVAVKIPIDFGNARKVVDERTGAYVPYSNLNYLLMYKDSLQRVHAEWVFLKPTLNWFNGNRRNFEGSIVVKDWNGNVLKSYNYGPAKPDQNNKLSSVKGVLMRGGNNMPLADGCLIWAVKAKCSCNVAWSSGVRQVGTWNPEKCDYCDYCVDYFCMPEPKCETCPPLPDWGGGSGGTGNNGGSGGTPPGGNGNGGGGGTGPGDYEPEDCTTGEQVVYPDGSMTPPPCVPIPHCENCPPTQNPPGPGVPLTVGQALINILNIDGELGLSKISYLNSVSNTVELEAMFQYLGVNGNNSDNRTFLNWAIENLTANNNLSFEQLNSIYESARNQNYTPKDREPATYYWRPKLTSTDFSNYLTETTPMDIEVSPGVFAKNANAFNCHYHAFGGEYASATLDGYPKWVLNIKLEGKKWKEVTGNVQVGDRVMYFADNNGILSWTHSAVVTEVDANGYATKVSSKMGTFQIIEHHPRDIPSSYGSMSPTFILGGKTVLSRVYWRKK